MKDLSYLQLVLVLMVLALFFCKKMLRESNIRSVKKKKKKEIHDQHAYTTVGKEALDLVLAIQHFEVYLSTICGPIIVYTDHNLLVFLNQMCGTNQRIMMWSLILQLFHLQIRHVRGKDNLIADALSWL